VCCLAATALSALTPSRASLAAEPRTYGTSLVSYVRVPGVAFTPERSEYGYLSSGYAWYRWTDGRLGAPIQLPSGARVVSMKMEFYDISAENSLHATLRSCVVSDCIDHPAAGAGPPDCVTPGSLCSGAAFAGGLASETADLTADDITVDNLTHTYLVEVTMSGNGSIGSHRIGSVVVGYILQVSPAPATATFGDVPASHPFFQFVEALAASGVTGGCGGGNYCPDAPLTRGQMAVFLAKALGLQWP